MYLPGFAQACYRKAPDFYFVDGLSGPGLCRLPDGSAILGSTLSAMRTEPRFARCVAMDLKSNNVAALKANVRPEDRARLVAEVGDVNQNFLALLDKHVPRRAPMFAFLDPEGLELDWSTVRRVAEHRDGPQKTELMILVPSSWIPRVAGTLQGPDAELNRTRLDFTLPGQWEDIWQARVRGELDAGEAREQFTARYASALEQQLGYAHVILRRITRAGRDDSAVYHMVFATDSPAGEKIMRHCFDRMFSNTRRDNWASGERPFPGML